jgi:hypothetical protein
MNRSQERRLAAAEARAARVRHPVPVQTHAIAEVEHLARKGAAAFGSLVRYYREEYGLPPEEALQRATEPWPESEENFLTSPPDEVTYGDLERIGQTDPDLAMRVWERVKAAARRELTSGGRAAEAVGAGEGRPWHLARFLAVWASLFEAWRPRDGMEHQLVEYRRKRPTVVVRSAGQVNIAQQQVNIGNG